MGATAEQLASRCLASFDECLQREALTQKQWAENRRADFSLWVDGVGALAGKKASLDARFVSKPRELILTLNLLLQLQNYLEDSLNATERTQLEEAKRNADAAIENLTSMAIAIRRTGHRHRFPTARISYVQDGASDGPPGVEGRTRAPSQREFEIGILCALTIEADAVETLFDNYWDDGPSYKKDRGDTNAYTLGSIGCHNVVLAYMPNMGKASAANVATHLSRSFPNIKLAIVVGICGVVPFSPVKKDEIILGDVVVSEGIIQYDLARRLPEGLVRKDSHQEALGRPPAEVRSILAKLKGRRGQQKWQNEMVTHLNKLQNDPDLKAEYPGAQNDRLFQASYRHRKDNLTCYQADCQGTVHRRRLTEGITQPTIHFGLIGSADTVMKSGLERDVIANREKILGFEMESAGVWDTVPSCLVIKGACDYADSHKTKAWQQYAAATAAACTKAFLTIGYQRTRDHQ